MQILRMSFLPGHFTIEPGGWKDYKMLARFHYRPKHPRTWTQIWAIRYRPPGGAPRLAAVGVLSYPIANSLARRRALHLRCSMAREIRFANRHLRTISRVIVHPQFRALGLSSLLIRWICEHCKTRYTEALATMARAHPFFDRAGMRRYAPRDAKSPVYFLYRKRRRVSHR